MSTIEAIHSPYGVRATSVAQPVVLEQEDDLLPFERIQLDRLITQVNCTPTRVRSAFLQHIRQNRRTYR